MEITTSSRCQISFRDGFSAQPLRVGRTEFAAPSPDRFMGNDDAALQQHFLDQPQAQGEPEIQLDRMGDDLTWKTVVPATDRRLAHPAQLSVNR